MIYPCIISIDSRDIVDTRICHVDAAAVASCDLGNGVRVIKTLSVLWIVPMMYSCRGGKIPPIGTRDMVDTNLSRRRRRPVSALNPHLWWGDIMTRQFWSSYDNALSKDFSLDLHWHYFVGDNDENTRFLFSRKCFHSKKWDVISNTSDICFCRKRKNYN